MLSALWKPATAGPEEMSARGPTLQAVLRRTRGSAALRSTTDTGHPKGEGEVTIATMVLHQDQEVMAVLTALMVTMETMARLVAMVTTSPMVATVPTLIVGDMGDIAEGTGHPGAGVTMADMGAIAGDSMGATAAVGGMGGPAGGGTGATSSGSTDWTNPICAHTFWE